MTNGSPYFTVFTPTFNRAHTLATVYASLCQQTFEDFEWIVVDDGSTDLTSEQVSSWQKNERLRIRYFQQENCGKHVAANRAVNEARGKLFVFLDSDDACPPLALERFRDLWEQIPESRRDKFSTLSVLCVDRKGEIVGGKYPASVVDVAEPWEQLKLRSGGDRWGVNRTDVLRQYPFPEIAGEKFISEGIVWNRMAVSYSARFVNEALRVIEYASDGLSASSRRTRVSSPRGARLYYNELSRIDLPQTQKLKSLCNYVRFSLHANTPLRQMFDETASPGLTFSLLPFGIIAYWHDRIAL